jgi:DNA polymerase-3 subunit gamma/tau
MEVLEKHFSAIAEKENAQIEPSAIALICRAADGSVRDGLSLLDQAIAHGAGTVSEEQVRDMLGLADRARVFDLFDAVMKGDITSALKMMTDQYAVGADPVVIIQDMLELTHWLTRLKLAPESAASAAVSETERVKGGEMAKTLSMATLTRVWQMLLKGLGEVRTAPSPLQAAEMVLVRLAYAADLPSPAEAIESLRNNPPPSGGGGGGGGLPAGAPAGGYTQALAQATVNGEPSGPTMMLSPGLPQMAPLAANAPGNALAAQGLPGSFAELAELFMEKREAVLAAELKSSVHLVRYEPGLIEFRPADGTSKDLAQKVSKLLGAWTGRPWLVSVSREQGEPTLRQQQIEAEIKRKQDAAAHPLVQAILTAFPGASIEAVRDLADETEEDGVTPVTTDTGDSEAATGEDE